MAVGHVRADHEEQLGTVEVLIGTRWPVGAKRQFVAAARAGHAQARVGFDVGGTHEALGQFVDQVLGFQRHLARHVEGQRIRPVGIEGVAQAGSGFADGLIHGNAHRVVIACLAHVGIFHAAGVGDGLAAGGALGAQAAEVGGVGLVADHLDHFVVLDLHDDAAAHATIRAHAAHVLVCHP